MVVQERYQPKIVGVDSTVTFSQQSVGGFLAKTSGTITVVDNKGVTIVDAVPVTAGIYLPLPFLVGPYGGSVTTAGGASGTVAL